MDVNVTTDIKGHGVPVVPAVEVEDQTKPQVQPVQENNESANTSLDEKALHSKEIVKEALKQPTREDAQRIVQELQRKLDPLATRLNFSVDEETGSFVVKVIDNETGDIIKQIPPEEMLNLRASLAELVGVLFDEKA